MPIQPADILPPGRMVMITRVDGDMPGPKPRMVPSALRPGMLARVTTSHQIGTNGSAVLMYGLVVGSASDASDIPGPRPEPLHAQLYADDVSPLPEVAVAHEAPALAEARRRFENSSERSISDKELKEVRTRKLTFHATPEEVAKAKARGEQQRREAEESRQAELAKRRAAAAVATPPSLTTQAAPAAPPTKFAEGTQNEKPPVSFAEAMASGRIK